MNSLWLLMTAFEVIFKNCITEFKQILFIPTERAYQFIREQLTFKSFHGVSSVTDSAGTARVARV